MNLSLAPLLAVLLQLAVLILIIGILVFVHELGHFLAAKLSGVKVNEFAFGFGRALWKRKWGDTLYRINVLPLGGYVSLEGETGSAGDNPHNYQNKSWAAKAFILTAGVLMNLLLALALFVWFLASSNYQLQVGWGLDYHFSGVESQNVYLYVSRVVENTAAVDKLNPGDIITKFNDQGVGNTDQFLELLKSNLGGTVELTLLDNQNLPNTKKVSIDLPASVADKQPILGVEFGPIAYELNYPHNVSASVSHGWNMLSYQISVLVDRISLSVQKGDASIVGEQVGSIVAVGVVIGDIIDSGQLAQLVNLTALISLSLALMNILPFPALDGGLLLVTSIESLTRRKIRAKWLDRINQLGFIFLLGLGILIIFKDVIQFQIVDSLISLFNSVLRR